MKGLDIGRWIEPSDFKSVLEKLGGKAKPLVVCFDDLERSQIPIAEVASFINQFVEHGDAKVVILCNEDEISDAEKYRRIKEKTVGFTRQFKPDRKAVGRSILSRFYSDKDFKSFLESNADHILYAFEASGYDNFRILNNVVLLLQTAFHAFESVDEKINFEQLFAIVPFAIEYQAGAVSKDEVVRLVQGGAPAIMGAGYFGGEDSDQAASLFCNKYAVLRDNSFFQPSASLADLIVEGSISPKRLKAERDAARPDDSPLGKAIEQMDYRFVELEQSEFEQCRDLLLDALRNGEVLSFEKYVMIANSMSHAQFVGVIGVEDADLVGAFDAGARAIVQCDSRELNALVEKLDQTIAQNGSFLEVALLRLRDHISQRVVAMQREQLSAAIRRVDIYPESLAQLLADNEKAFSIGLTPIAPLLPAKEFANIFLRSPNASKARLGRCLEYRYNRKSPVIGADQTWISELSRLLEESVSDFPPGTIAHHLTAKAAAITRNLLFPEKPSSNTGVESPVNN